MNTGTAPHGIGTVDLLVRRFLADYARNPVNIIMLVIVPVAFVVVASGPMADAAEVLGGSTGPAVHTATAGWAAGFLAGIAMYFQVRAARAADRRLVQAGMRPADLAVARSAAGLTLAGLAAAAALLALAARTGIDDPARVAAGTLMFAVIYLAIGAIVGALVTDPVNGTVLILFIWIMDVFFGPAIGAADRLLARALPTHFVTLWMVDLPSWHGGRLGDLGWALVWLITAVVAGWIVVRATVRTSGRRRTAPPGSRRDQIRAGLGAGLRTQARNPVLWLLLGAVPAVFVLLSVPITPDEPGSFTVREAGRQFTGWFPLKEAHPATMAPIAVASLAALAGLFVTLDARTADRRLSLAGFRIAALLSARLAVVGLAALVAAGASLAITSIVFSPRQWGVYALAIALIGLTYALVGVVLATLFGRVAGVFVAFLVPFLDVGIEQSPMLRAAPSAWAQALPGWGAGRVMIDGALTPAFDEPAALSVALGWLAVLIVIGTLLFRRAARHAG